LLLVGAALVYWQTARFRLVNYDDDKYIIGPILQGLRLETARWAFTEFHEGNWTPLTWLSHMLDTEIYRGWPGGRHLTNVLLYGASVVVLFLALRQMTGRLWPSAAAAALWAIHPLRVESVAWVTERKDVLAGFFFVLALWAYADYARRPFSIIRYLTVIVLFALGLIAKPIVITLPVVLLLLDYWPLGRVSDIKPRSSIAPTPARSSIAPTPARSSIAPTPAVGFSAATKARSTIAALWWLVLEKLPLLGLAAASSVLTVWAQAGTIAPEERMSFLRRLGEVPVSYVFYLFRFFYPVDLAAFYPRPSHISAWAICASSLALLGITAVALASWRRRPYLLVGWLWYLGMLLPAIGLVQFGVQSVADRFTYLPQIGLAMALVWYVVDVACGKRERGEGREERADRTPSSRPILPLPSPLSPLLSFAAVGALAILAALSWRQTSFWCDSESLWIHDLQCVPENSLGENDLGLALYEKRRSDEAIGHYEKAVKLDPHYFMAINNFGAALAERGRFEEAIARYRQALALVPGDMGTHCNMAAALISVRRFDEAAEHCRLALKAQPRCGKAYFDLGRICDAQHRPAEAVENFDRALKLAQNDPDPHFSVAEAYFAAANLLANQGRLDEAIGHYGALLAIEPRLANVRNDLAVALATDGRLDEAIAQYQAAVAIAPAFAIARKNLDAALAQRRDFESQITGLRRALGADRARADLMTSLAWRLAACPVASLRNANEAIELAERANRLCGGKHFEPLMSLAAAYAEAGRFPEAVATASHALALVDAQAQPAVASQIRAQIGLYQAGKPIRIMGLAQGK
jgi:tetratricopeptide (TPR) repeat protein